MGNFTEFKHVNEILTKCSNYIETGTGFGTSLSFASRFSNLKKIWSCEIDRVHSINLNANLVQQAGEQDRIHILNMNSFDFLSIMFKHFLEKEDSVIFLDAHFPSADLGKKKFDEEGDENIRLPLLSELDLFFKYRAGEHNDYLIIDDILLYDDTRDYESGEKKKTMPEILPRNLEQRNCLNDIKSRLEETHYVKIFTEAEGYLIATPKEHEKIWD